MKPTAPCQNKLSVLARDTLPWLISFSLGNIANGTRIQGLFFDLNFTHHSNISVG